jgi:hypothetical protein
MKPRMFVPPLVLFAGLLFSGVFSATGTVVTFDDLSPHLSGSFITNVYEGLVWSNFGAVNAVLDGSINGLSGYYYGMVSASNVAYNGFGLPAEIDSPVTNFNFLSAYLTGAWNSNLNIEIQGFRGGALLYDQTALVGATNPMLFTFNYLNIDRLYFNSFGGQNAGFPSGSGTHFVMDDLTFEFVPEPSSLLLTAGGVLTLWAFLKRKRA